MTKDEFQKRYHHYQTHSEEAAKAEAARANLEGIEGDEAVPVEFGQLGWCLMLKSARDFASEMNLL